MPKQRKDPIVAVLAYFTEAPLEAAQIALALAKETVKGRGPQGPPRTRTRKKPIIKGSDPASVLHG